MARAGCVYWAPVLIACFATSVEAAPIHYTTAGSAGSHVRFDGIDGTFEPGSAISLGKFVIGAPSPGSSTSVDDEPFVIALRTPAFDQPVPAGPDTAPYPTTIESSLLIRGRLSGVIREGAPDLVATVDSVELGGLGPYPTGHIQRFSFPVPLADVKLPTEQLLLASSDGWDGSTSRSVELTAQIVPEPAAWAAWGLTALIGVIARRGIAGPPRTRRPA